MSFVKPRIDWGGHRGGGFVGVGCPVWNKHECSLSSLRHHTSLPTFTAVLEKREKRVGGEDLGMGYSGCQGGGEGGGSFLEEVRGKSRGGWDLRPSSELIGTAVLFYPPTKTCSFWKAYY